MKPYEPGRIAGITKGTTSKKPKKSNVSASIATGNLWPRAGSTGSAHGANIFYPMNIMDRKKAKEKRRGDN
ncbi:MAG: hypothetical protein QME78_13185 [Thermodesulfobacteriota bacterium]|nr:hypothetical protein [Thermodesulfobacteriota bacterium]